MKLLHYWATIATLVTLAILDPYTATGAPLDEAQSRQHTIQLVETNRQPQPLARAEGPELEPVKKEDPRWEDVMSTGGIDKKNPAGYRVNAEYRSVGRFQGKTKRSKRSKRAEDPRTPPDANDEARGKKTGDGVEQGKIRGLTHEQITSVLSPEEFERYAETYEEKKTFLMLKARKKRGKTLSTERERLFENLRGVNREFDRMQRKVENGLIESGNAPPWLIERRAKTAQYLKEWAERNKNPNGSESEKAGDEIEQAKIRGLTHEQVRSVLSPAEFERYATKHERSKTFRKLETRKKRGKPLSAEEEQLFENLRDDNKKFHKMRRVVENRLVESGNAPPWLIEQRARRAAQNAKGAVERSKKSNGLESQPPTPPDANDDNDNNNNNRLHLSYSSTTDAVNRLPNRFTNTLSDMGKNLWDNFSRVTGRLNHANHYPPGTTTPAAGNIRPASVPGPVPMQPPPPLALF